MDAKKNLNLIKWIVIGISVFTLFNFMSTCNANRKLNRIEKNQTVLIQHVESIDSVLINNKPLTEKEVATIMTDIAIKQLQIEEAIDKHEVTVTGGEQLMYEFLNSKYNKNIIDEKE